MMGLSSMSEPLAIVNELELSTKRSKRKITFIFNGEVKVTRVEITH